MRPVLASCVVLLLAGNSAAASAAGPAITLGLFGHRLVPPGTNGDTWDSAWLANDKVYVEHNDGNGWGRGGRRNGGRGIGELLGTPEAPASISGIDLNPGKFGSFLTWTYSTGLYEVDGVLYCIKQTIDQIPGKWRSYDGNILKSVDGGATWVNHWGQTDTVPREYMFPGDRARNDPWGQLNFVKYGRGGAAPEVDNAQKYVYLSSSTKDGQHLARVKRADLPSLDRARFQFYTGGDGTPDRNWTNDISRCLPITRDATGAGAWRVFPWCSVLYNEALRRYVSVACHGDSWLQPPIEGSFFLLESPHPWGPWTQVLGENLNRKELDNLTFPYLLQKFSRADGRKMWMTVSGRNPYGLQFMPVYLTTAPLQSYAAASAVLTGTTVSRGKEGYSGPGYVTGFDAPGHECLFKIRVEKAGAYLLKLRYNTRKHQSLDFLVNGRLREKLPLGKAEQVYATWTEMSLAAWLEAGQNTVAFRGGATGESADVNLDRLSLAWYSAAPGSLPDCRPPARR